MVTPEEIEALIRGGLPDADVDVIDETGGGDHFQALVISPSFAGKSLVERHQSVYGALQGAMQGRIHALALKTYTPQEWEKLR